MYELPPDRRNEFSTEDVLLALVPGINLVIAAFLLLRSESRKRGLVMLVIALVVSGSCYATRWLLFARPLKDVSFPAWGDLSWASQPRLWLWVVVAIAVPASTVRYLQSRRMTRAWQVLAARVGVDYEPGGCFGLSRRARMTGNYRRRKLELYTYHPMLIDNILDRTRLELAVANPSELRMRLDYVPARNVANDLLKGRNQVQIGDPAFDDAFALHSESPTCVSMVFAAQDLRQRLYRLRRFTTVELNQTVLALEQTGRECDADYLHFCFDVLSDLADAIEQLGDDSAASSP